LGAGPHGLAPFCLEVTVSWFGDGERHSRARHKGVARRVERLLRERPVRPGKVRMDIRREGDARREPRDG